LSIDLIPEKDVAKPDLRNSKKSFLDIDHICLTCGAIINLYWADDCIVCDCKPRNFVPSKISKDIRLILEMPIEELKLISDLEGLPANSSRVKLTINLLRKIHPILKNPNHSNIDEILIRKVILRNHRKFSYMKDIEDLVKRKKPIKVDVVKPKHIKLIPITKVISTESNQLKLITIIEQTD